MGSSRDSVWRSAAEKSVTVLNPAPSTASIPRTRSVPSEAGGAREIAGVVSRRLGYRPAIVLVFLLLVFVLIQCLLPLRSAIKIGADEGFELGKATLCLNGYKLYTDIWNDQPPLHTFLITQVLKYLSPSVLGPRLLTMAFSSVLLAAVFFAGLRINGLLTAALSSVWLIAAPGFVELSSSVMQEIPALAPAVAALSVLLVCRRTPCPFGEILAGILFAVALQMKFIGVVYLPLGALILWLRHREAAPAQARPSGTPSEWVSREVKGGSALGACLEIPVWCPAFRLPGSRSTLKRGQQTVSPHVKSFSNHALSRFIPANVLLSMLSFVVGLAIGFVVIILLTGEGAYWLQIQQSWSAHFASAKSSEYGSPNDHPFDWSVLLKNWDATFPALLGIIVCLRQVRRKFLGILPVAWLGLALGVFGAHKPWWSYYYVHTAVPLCLCAAIGVADLWQRFRVRRSWSQCLLIGVFTLSVSLWMCARVYLQIASIRHSPQTYSALVLAEIERLKPFTRFLYTDDPVYSFHTGIPLPPKLGVISFKRFWSGDLTNLRLAEELEAVKPGILLLKNSTEESPFNDLIHAQYRLIYEDADYRLYGHEAVLAQVKKSRASQ